MPTSEHTYSTLTAPGLRLLAATLDNLANTPVGTTLGAGQVWIDSEHTGTDEQGGFVFRPDDDGELRVCLFSSPDDCPDDF